MSYIAIDLGNKRVGLAISQENIAFPLGVIQRVELIKYLKSYLQEHREISTIVVGLPYDLYWKDLRQLNKTRDFIEKLIQFFPHMLIVWHDERFSSFEASSNFWDHRDDIAAQCILQSYIDSKK